MCLKVFLLFAAICYGLSNIKLGQMHALEILDHKYPVWVDKYYPDENEDTENNKKKNGSFDDFIDFLLRGVVKRSFQRSYYPRRQNLIPAKAINGIQAPIKDKQEGRMYISNPCKAANFSCPLMVTPLIEAGKVAEALAMAEVPKISSLSSIKSYSGFFTVNATGNTNMFFWFFPAMEVKYAPIVVRLAGGPGQSALFDIFNGIGPFRLDEKLRVHLNPHTLARTANILYFDNPIGTGFSYTDAKYGYPTTQEAVAEHLYSAINQFLKLFPEYKDNYIYISGEEYGAKYALCFARKVYEMKDNTPVNLKGIILGSPYLDPEVIFSSYRFLFEAGILCKRESDFLHRHLKKAQSEAAEKNYSSAMDIVEESFGSPYRIPVNKKYYLPFVTASEYQYILGPEDPKYYEPYTRFVNQARTRQALHVGNLPFQDGRKTYEALRDDILQSSRNDLAAVIDHYRILIYNGNLDRKTPASLTSEILERVNWKHLEEFKRNERMLWKLEADYKLPIHIGYIRRVTGLVQVLVFDSGHLVASDQPEATYDAINRFIWDQEHATI